MYILVIMLYDRTSALMFIIDDCILPCILSIKILTFVYGKLFDYTLYLVGE